MGFRDITICKGFINRKSDLHPACTIITELEELTLLSINWSRETFQTFRQVETHSHSHLERVKQSMHFVCLTKCLLIIMVPSGVGHIH